MKTQLLLVLLILFFSKTTISSERIIGKPIKQKITNEDENIFNDIFEKAEKSISFYKKQKILLNYLIINKAGKEDSTLIKEIDTTIFEPVTKPSSTCPINKEFKANNIYYDLNECQIRPDAAIELDKIVMIMLDNEEIRVEMGAHTDARASDEYNFLLSQKRAKAALDYLISKGVNKERISAIGYGKTQLVNNCDGTSDCSEEEHQVNRRMEIKLIFEQNLNIKYTKNEVIKESEDL